MFVESIFLLCGGQRRHTVSQPNFLRLAVGSRGANDFVQAAVATKSQCVQISRSCKMLKRFLFLVSREATLAPPKMQLSETVVDLRCLTKLFHCFGWTSRLLCFDSLFIQPVP